ncbi:MAG: NAD(P)-dependent oxidoreductase [Gemmataceae bacterium]|nr:NAD(P)-dependent oxidoreductase [Gemmataceae bacterium]
MKTVLVTGASGEVGRGVVPFLETVFDLRLLDLAPAGDDPRRVQADLLDRDALARAMNGVEAVLHLAVASGHEGTYEDATFNDLRFDVNVKGTYHVFEAAQRLGVPHVVLVSSVMVTWGQALAVWRAGSKELVPGDAPPSPVGTYALTKALAEQVAEHYSRLDSGLHGSDAQRLEVLTVRIAAPLDLNAPDLGRRPVRPQQVPVPDLARAFEQALTVPVSGYQVVTIVGDSSRRLWDLGPAQRVLGYRPQYSLDDLGIPFAEPFPPEVR